MTTAQAHAAREWLEPVGLAHSTAASGPRLAVTADGTRVLAWNEGPRARIAVATAGSPPGPAHALEGASVRSLSPLGARGALLVLEGRWTPARIVELTQDGRLVDVWPEGRTLGSNPVLATDRHGNAAVVSTAARGELTVARRSPATGTWSDQRVVGSTGQHGALAVAAALTGRDGDAVIAWTAALQYTASAAVVRADGSVMAPPALVSTPGARSFDPVVGGDGQGRAVVAWFERTGAGAGVLQAAVAAPGGGFGRPTALGRLGDRASLATSPGGRVAIAWRSRGLPGQSDRQHVVHGDLAAAPDAAAVFGEPVTVSTAGADPAVAMDSRGNTAVVAATRLGLQVTRRSASGANGLARTVACPTSDHAPVALGVDEDGNLSLLTAPAFGWDTTTLRFSQDRASQAFGPRPCDAAVPEAPSVPAEDPWPTGQWVFDDAQTGALAEVEARWGYGPDGVPRLEPPPVAATPVPAPSRATPQALTRPGPAVAAAAVSRISVRKVLRRGLAVSLASTRGGRVRIRLLAERRVGAALEAGRMVKIVEAGRAHRVVLGVRSEARPELRRARRLTVEVRHMATGATARRPVALAR